MRGKMIYREYRLLCVPPRRQLHTFVRNIANRRAATIESVHDGGFDTLKGAASDAKVCHKKPVTRELMPNCTNDVVLPLFKHGTLPRGPTPALPDLLPDAPPHRCDVEYVVVAC